MESFNSFVTQTLGVEFINPTQFLLLVVLFAINLTVVTIITRYFYYPRSQRRDYFFVYVIMSMSIFLLVSLMDGNAMNTGAALGLFAIFGIIRYRTEAIPIREMTYLFLLVAVSVINAMGKGDYHRKSGTWEGTGLLSILFANVVFIVLAWVFESGKIVHQRCSKYIKYDNLNLIAPDKREELKADLEKRTGIKIQKIELGTIDFLRDSCLIRIFYDDPNDVGSSVGEMTKIPSV